MADDEEESLTFRESLRVNWKGWIATAIIMLLLLVVFREQNAVVARFLLKWVIP